MFRRTSLFCKFTAATASATAVACCPTVNKENNTLTSSAVSFANAIAKIRVEEEKMRLRWTRDEDNWRKLPARAWPEYQPDVQEIPMLESKVTNSCAKGDSPACREAKFNLATALVFNNMDHEKGLALYESLAGGGDERGMTALGICLVEGLGIPNDYNVGSRWLKKASDMQYSQGIYELATLYYTGAADPYVKEDLQQAFKLFQLAAKLEHTCGLYMEADMLLTGDGCEKDAARAVDLLYRAGERGHRFARATLLKLLRDEKIIIAELEKSSSVSK
jgi:TPR repeat protein